MKINFEEAIKTLLEKMNLEEKVGQLQQCGPSLVGAFDVDFEELLNMVYDGRISSEKFHELMSSVRQDFHEADLRAGKIGSYNGISDAETVNRLQKIAVEETRLGIPLLFGYDVIHGYRTITPIPLGESCAWEPELWERTARVSAKEATAGGIHMTFAPMVDVSRDARWGRVSEGAGEDVLLSASYGAAKVKGFQGDDLKRADALAACAKHFAGYGAVEGGRDYNRVDMSMQRFFEEYLPPFEACVKAGVRGIMPAFNDLNGVPCTVNHWLLTDLLREKWGFDGMTISDANAIDECVNHGCTNDRAEAAKAALEAGVDMDMVSGVYTENLESLIKSGVVAEKTLDQAVANVLRVKFELGLFEQPYQTSPEREKAELLKKEYRETAREAAVKSMVLLKNDSILPLKDGTRLGIIGGLAAARGEMTGTWALKGDGKDCISIVDACMVRNIDFQFTSGDELEELRKVADNCEVLLVAVGELKKHSGEAASRTDISLPAEQLDILKRLKETGKPVVAVLFNGRPLAIPWAAENIPAILEAWHPGVEAGNAIVDILFGCCNPSGKLTTTFPYASGQCPVYYAHINTGRPGGSSKFTSKYIDAPIEPVYPFGHGLSYTTYQYLDLSVKQQGDEITVSVKVQNTGSMDGEEIVQCYIHDLVGKRVRPVRQLVDFSKLSLKAGEEREASFIIPPQKLGYYDEAMNYVIEAGVYEIYVGGSSVNCLSQVLDYQGKGE